MPRRLLLIAPIAAVVATASLLLSGCSVASPATPPSEASGSHKPTAPATSSHTTATTACALVTEQDATTALGSDPGAGTPNVSGTASSCSFGQYPALLTVNLVAVNGKADFDHLVSRDTSHTLVALSGVGDAAFALAQGEVANVWFTHGDAMVTIVLVQSGAGTNSQDVAMTVAQAADARL